MPPKVTVSVLLGLGDVYFGKSVNGMFASSQTAGIQGKAALSRNRNDLIGFFTHNAL